MDDKIKKNLSLVYFVINTYYPRFKQNEDIFQLGLIGLWKALQTFDKTKNIKFNTYTARCIRNEINTELERMNAQKRQLDREGMCISLNTLLSDSEDSSEEWIQNIQSVSIESNPLYLLQLDELYKEQDDRTKFIIHSKLQGHQTKHIAKQLNVSGQTIRRIWNSLEREVRDIVAD